MVIDSFASRFSASNLLEDIGRGTRRVAEIVEAEREYSDLEEVWKSEKASVQGSQHVKEELELARRELETAKRAGDLTRMAEIQYGRIPELEREIEDATDRLDVLQAEKVMLKEEVDAEDVAEVVSAWTGVPVSRLLEGEVEKLIRLEGVLHVDG